MDKEIKRKCPFCQSEVRFIPYRFVCSNAICSSSYSVLDDFGRLVIDKKTAITKWENSAFILRVGC